MRNWFCLGTVNQMFICPQNKLKDSNRGVGMSNTHFKWDTTFIMLTFLVPAMFSWLRLFVIVIYEI